MKKSISNLISLIKKGGLDPLELTEKLLQRIKKYDGVLNSYVALNPDAEKHAKSLNKSALLCGLPVSVKDLIDTAKIPTTYGSVIFKNYIPKRDAKVVANLKRAGAFVLGKTNTHEFALGIETPPTRNPWDITRIPGGSSGGSAASIAADLAVFALGTDTGGSIRIPASMCGITGLKPTYSNISTQGVFPESWSLDHVGPMCRFASDLPLLLEGMGYRVKRSSKFPLKLGLESNFLSECKKDVKSALEAFVNKLVSERVAEVQEVSFPLLEQINSAHSIIDTSEIATVHKKIYPKHKKEYLPLSIEQIELGLKRSAVEYVEAIRFRSKAVKRVSYEFRRFDVLVTPTMPSVAPKISEVKKMTLEELYPFVKFLEPFNFLGFPALVVPCGFANLPIGVQLVSKPNQEGVLIGLAERYQSVTDWHTRTPAMFGELDV